MEHCKHSRLAKALSDHFSSKRQRGHSMASHWRSFYSSFYGGDFRRVKHLDSHATRERVHPAPLFILIHKLVCFLLVFFSLSSHFAPNVSQLVVLQPVHPEGVLGGGVGQHHVGVVEHVQSIQSERVDFQLVQRKLRVRVKAHVADQRVGQLFGETWRRFTCD